MTPRNRLIALALIAPLAACHRAVDLRTSVPDGGSPDGGRFLIDSARVVDAGLSDAGVLDGMTVPDAVAVQALDALSALPAGEASSPGADSLTE